MIAMRSLQRRLAVGLAGGVLLMWLLASLAAGIIIKHELDEAFDSALQEMAQRLLSLSVDDLLNQQGEAVRRESGAIDPHREFLTYLVRNADGQVLIQSHDADIAVFPPRPLRGFRDTATHRLYGESAVSGTLFIEVAEPLRHRHKATLEAAMVLLLPLPLLLPLSLFGAWWYVRRSLRPLLALRAQIERRGGGDLSAVAASGLPQEIGPIADAVNQLLQRLRSALEAERSFTTNSAHELRTPLAGALAQVQRLLAEAPPGALHERAQRVEAALQQLALRTEKLLQLARAEGAGLLANAPSDLTPVLDHLVAELRQSADGGARLRLIAEAAGPLRSSLDPDAFAILMRNLIENALRHGAADQPVTIHLRPGGHLSVVNAGPAVPAAQLARLKGRFERGPTMAAGSGLGLAIADTIARGAGAKLRLLSPASGHNDGFEAILELNGA